MTNQQKIFSTIETHCLRVDVKLTPKRKKILDILYKSEAPLSAYEIADLYNHDEKKPMHAMSIYRILNLFLEINIIHKLASQNKYIFCSHITCDHNHVAQQFLICKKCKKVKEIELNPALINELNANIKKSGFQIDGPQLEIDCICEKCAREDIL